MDVRTVASRFLLPYACRQLKDPAVKLKTYACLQWPVGAQRQRSTLLWCDY